MPGQRNFFIWGRGIIAAEPAIYEHGRLYDLGRYPMLIEANPGAPVYGILISLDPHFYPDTLARLDELEGYDPQRPNICLYWRVQREVRLIKDGRYTPCWVYVGQPHQIQGYPLILSGDWKAR